MNKNLVLFFTKNVSLEEWKRTGLLTREIQLYKKLIENGWNVVFVTYDKRIPSADIMAIIQPIRVIWKGHLPSFFYAFFLPFLHREQLSRATIFKTNQIRGALVALWTGFFFKKPVIVRCGYLWSELASDISKKSRWLRWFVSLYEKICFNLAWKVNVSSESMASIAHTRYRIPTWKIMIVPNFVDLDLFRPAPKTESAEAKIIGFVGRLTRQKNLSLLLEAVNLSKFRRNINLQIIGNGEEKEKIEKLSRKLGIEVNWIPPQSNDKLPGYYRRFDLFVLPSRKEGLPKALLEAMACGVAPIGTDVAGIRDIIKDKVCGLLVPEDKQALADAMDQLLSDDNLRHNLAFEARKRIEKKYSLNEVFIKELGVLGFTS